MQPVVCWEKVWVTPESAPSGSSMKIYKWMKTDKKQQFSDDEEEADEPLAPLPDEPEVVEGDEDMDQDEPGVSVVPDATQDATEANFASQEGAPEPQTKPSSPRPPALSLQPTEPMLTVDEGAVMLDASFKGLDGDMTVDVDVHENANQNQIEDVVGELDMSVLDPDGMPYEGVHGLGELDSAEALLASTLMDAGGDPFAPSMEPQPSDQEAAG